ncbi:hypothetical protein [Mycobacteroides abscessus]|uniref:hypothetical protein n=1 Tax=Mycobacteroides abscessus TaxID=36809 RepID=UPI0009A8CD57|nr:MULTISPECIES: hypothetical protein [Mycobacteriaceae]SLD30378.1 Uncharacterised protein [Mycobacteroides abscessus subsp. massiliense]SLD38241.1 Uncharacterised protein [Mycobacteroides abscessus subsp. massiliense]
MDISGYPCVSDFVRAIPDSSGYNEGLRAVLEVAQGRQVVANSPVDDDAIRAAMMAAPPD